MDDKKKRFIRDLRDLAKAHKETAEALENGAGELEGGNINMVEFLNILEEKNQRAYIEVAP